MSRTTSYFLSRLPPIPFYTSNEMVFLKYNSFVLPIPHHWFCTVYWTKPRFFLGTDYKALTDPLFHLHFPIFFLETITQNFPSFYESVMPFHISTYLLSSCHSLILDFLFTFCLPWCKCLETINIGAEKKRENRRMIEKIDEIKSWFFEMIKKWPNKLGWPREKKRQFKWLKSGIT